VIVVYHKNGNGGSGGGGGYGTQTMVGLLRLWFG